MGKYETKRFGAPYGQDGEYGPDVDSIDEAGEIAQATLHPGQSMVVYDQERPIARYDHGPAVGDPVHLTRIDADGDDIWEILPFG